MAVGHLSPERLQGIKEAANMLVSVKIDIGMPAEIAQYLDTLAADCAGYVDKPASPPTIGHPDRM